MSGFQERLREEFTDKEYAHAYMEESLNHYIATQIKVLREQRGLTQAQLAELAGMKQTRISVLENVEYESWSIKTLKQLAQAFDLVLFVSFETFSSSIDRLESFSRESLERISRETDLVQKKNVLEDVLLIDRDVLNVLQYTKLGEIKERRTSALDAAEAGRVQRRRSNIAGESGYSSSATLYAGAYRSLGTDNIISGKLHQ